MPTAEPHALSVHGTSDVPMRHALHMHIGRQTRERPAGCKVPALPLRHQGRINCLHFQSFMFIKIPARTSDCVEVMYVDPIRAIVQVAYAKGNIYEYTHVSRRAIANLLLNRNMSLGFWVNENLLPYNCKSAAFGTCRALDVLFTSSMPVTESTPQPDYVTA